MFLFKNQTNFSMKKVYTLFLFVSMALVSFGQTFIWEGFDAGQMPPSGWTIDGYAAQWSVSNTANAGGAAPEGMFTYVSANSTTRLVSPACDLTGLTSVKLSFKHMYDWYTNPAPKVGVATRSAGGAWTSVWEITPTGNVGPQQIDLEISNSDVGAADFQFCLYINGNFYNLDYWYVDNILLFNPLNLDGALTSITTPTFIGGPTPVTGTVMNMGQTTITDLVINWQLNNGTVHTSSFTGLTIPTLGIYSFSCTDLVDAPIGSHVLTVWIDKVNGSVDDDQSNDTLQKTIKKACNIIPKKPCFEEFTSSTCAPCASFNTGFVPWCETHEDDITLIKYQMNWPGAGDPYYTLEGGTRRDFYGVGWVPWLVCNGSYVETDMSAVQTAYDMALQQPGLVDIVASHVLNGTSMTVDLTALPFVNFSDVNVYVIVFEYVTTGNIMTNGETEFHHVMMKMMPDGNGTTTDLTDRQPFTLEQTQDLAGTHVEEWDDLGVLVFVQDAQSQEIYQSFYSVENGTFAAEARLDDILVDGTSLAGFDPDVFDYDVEVPGGILIPEISGIPIDPNATVIVVPATEIPGTTTIDVFAEDLSTHVVYNVNLIWSVGQDENRSEAIRIYPNPTSCVLNITGAPHAAVEVFNSTGVQVRSVQDFSGQSLNLTDLAEGVYMISIRTEQGTLVRKKLVIVH